MIYDMALPLAEKLQALLAPGCKRIEIAGSVRRQKADPGDIELVAIPDMRPPRPLFGYKGCTTTLDFILAGLERGDDEAICLHPILGGPKYKKYWVSLDGGISQCIKLDLFLCTPPSDWGVEFLIRTGPSEFSHWLVSPRYVGGGMPNGYHCEGNRIVAYDDGTYIPCPEEIDLLRFCGLDWIEPKNRIPMWQRPVRKIRARETAKI